LGELIEECGVKRRQPEFQPFAAISGHMIPTAQTKGNGGCHHAQASREESNLTSDLHEFT
jgi:hypothetical protein